jgi:hypothetical protein
MAHAQLRLRWFLDIQLSVLGLIQSVELRFHKRHPLLLRDLAVLVGIHNEKQLLDLGISEAKFFLRLRNCCLLAWARRCETFK